MATYYVSTTGNDGSAGTSSGTAFLTPGKAFSVHSGGDLILLATGTYPITSASTNIIGDASP